MKSSDDNQFNDQRKKIMVIGIATVMVVVTAFWVVNFKNFINPYSKKLTVTESEKVSWSDLKGRFDKTMLEAVGKMDQIEAKKTLASSAVNASSSLNNLENILNAKIGEVNSSSTGLNASSSSSTKELKARLNDMEKNLEKK